MTETVEVQGGEPAPVVTNGNPVDRLRRQLLDRFARVISERGLTQTDAAMIAGVDQPTLSKALSGRLQTLTLDRVIGWLNAFDESVDFADPAPARSPVRDQAVLDSVGDSLFAVDADGIITHMNAAAARHLGLDPLTAIGRDLLEAVPATSQPQFQAACAAARAGAPQHYERESGVAAGRMLDIQVLPIGDGAIAIVFTDITERKLGEKALRESETRFRLIADSAPVPMWVTRLDRKREFVNRAYVDFLGIDYAEAVDFDWRDIIHPEDLPRIVAEQIEKEAALEPFTLEARYRNAAGDWRWLRSESQPRWGVDGAHIGFIGVAYDVTIAKEAELRLQGLVEARTAELEALYRRTPTLLHSQSPDGRVISVSDKWLEFMGFSSRDEVIGRPIKDFMAAECWDAHEREHWPRLLSTGSFDDVEYKAVKKSGEIAEVLVSSRMWFDAEGRFARTMAAMVDVTGRRRTEEALRQSQKVEAMGQLTGGVAHDFNNLLSPIIGGLDFLQRREIGGEREQRMIAGALQAAERAKTLVQRLLAFARRQPLQPTSVDLRQLIGGMEALIASTMGPRIRVQVDVPADLPFAFADANQVEMALLNLSVNARDAMPDGGRLRIAVQPRRCAGDPLRGLEPGDYIALTVTDDGVGMDEATLARAIEPFFSTKGIGRGTGLGLSMVHGLAAQLGGALTLKSSPGAGTTVELLLPAATNAVAAREAAGDEKHEAQAGRALLIDDEELVRGSTAAMLEELGFEVVQCDSAATALAQIEAGLTVDLVVTDHLMPDLTGAELARRLRSARPTLPVLIISGYAETDGIAADLPRLAKPFRQTDLARSIAKLPETI